MSKFDGLKERIWNGVATDDELRSISIEDVVAIKSDGEHVRLRPCTRAKPRIVDANARRIEHVASDESADRMGDVIRVRGWKLDSFKKNPQLLFNHNHDEPLGQVPGISKGEHRGNPALLSESELYPNEKLTEARRIIAKLAEDGDLPAVSVGFVPLKASRPSDAEERAAIGLGEWGVLYEGCELLELSVVTVPANANALMRKLDSMVDAGTIAKSLAVQVAKEWQPSTRVVVPVSKVEPLYAQGGVASAVDRETILAILPEIGERITRALSERSAAPVESVSTVTRLAALESRTAELCKLVGALNSTLNAELPALKGLLAVPRASSPQPASLVDPQARTQEAEQDKSADPVAVLHSLVTKVRANNKG